MAREGGRKGGDLISFAKKKLTTGKSKLEDHILVSTVYNSFPKHVGELRK